MFSRKHVLTEAGTARLKKKYEQMRSSYCDHSVIESFRFDAELVENVIANMKRGKAAGLDAISAEHMQYSHAIYYLLCCQSYLT